MDLCWAALKAVPGRVLPRESSGALVSRRIFEQIAAIHVAFENPALRTQQQRDTTLPDSESSCTLQPKPRSFLFRPR